MSVEDATELSHNATVSCFTVERDGDGVRISWGDDPLDFIWQTDPQIRDLIAMLQGVAL